VPDTALIERFVVGALETNCYLVYNKAGRTGFLIDPGSFDRTVKDFIDRNGICIKNIINTHGHIDHIAGNKKFGYPILIHESDSDFLKNPVKNLSFFTGIMPSLSLMAGFLKDGDRIAEGAVAFCVIHTPGHTPGSISLKFGNRIFTGDTLFREGVGRTDFPYASEKDLLNSVKCRLMVFDDNVEIFPGHGPPSTIGHERKKNPFI